MKPIHLNAVQRAIDGARKLPAEARLELKRIMRDAFDEFRKGADGLRHWRTMADALNIAEELSAAGICSDEASVGKIEQAQETLSAAMERHEAGETWTLYPVEMALLEEGLFLHGVQLDYCSLREYENAVLRVKHRTEQALAGNVGPGVVVVGGGHDLRD